jgi:sRNA-binding carbon storage regulator CsrA
MLVLQRVTRENDNRDGRRRGGSAFRITTPSGDVIWVELLRQRGLDISVGIDAPQEVEIVREDVLMRYEREQQMATGYAPEPAREDRSRPWYDDPEASASRRFRYR